VWWVVVVGLIPRPETRATPTTELGGGKGSKRRGGGEEEEKEKKKKEEFVYSRENTLIAAINMV